MVRLPIAVVLFCLVGLAANAAPDCDSGTADAKAIVFAANDDASQAALQLTITDAFDHVAMIYIRGMRFDDPQCLAATFSMGGLNYRIAADDNSVTPRRTLAGGPDGGRNVFLFATLRPEAAVQAFRVSKVNGAGGIIAFAQVHRSDLIYVLAASPNREARWEIFGFYDKIPDTGRLAQAMCEAVLGSLPVIATFRTGDKEVELKGVSVASALSDIDANGPCTVGSP